MAACIPCFIIPLLLFIFHRFIQPIILKFWNPWASDKNPDEISKESRSFLEKYCPECVSKNGTAEACTIQRSTEKPKFE